MYVSFHIYRCETPFFSLWLTCYLSFTFKSLTSMVHTKCSNKHLITGKKVHMIDVWIRSFYFDPYQSNNPSFLAKRLILITTLLTVPATLFFYKSILSYRALILSYRACMLFYRACILSYRS